MESDKQFSLAQTRQLLQQLRDLGNTRAPDSLLPAVLTRLGLEHVPVTNTRTIGSKTERVLARPLADVLEIEYTSARSSQRDLVLSQMSLAALADCCMSEIQHYRHKEPYNDRYCLEIFHRAMVRHDPQAWELLQQRFTPTVKAWMRNHPHRDIACHHQSEEDYVADTFARVWQASMRNRLEFGTLAAALSYLKSSLQGAVIDKLRAYSRSKEAPLPEPGSDAPHVEEPASEDAYGSHDMWEVIRSLLPNKRERRLAYLLYYCGLKPREVMQYCPREFSDIQEIYRLTRNIREQLMRNCSQLRMRLSDEEF
jgi:DNA-directed RNA polymerase specialized sigma24 family protein